MQRVVGRYLNWNKLSAGMYLFVDSTVLPVRIYPKEIPGKVNMIEHVRGIMTSCIQQRKAGNNQNIHQKGYV